MLESLLKLANQVFEAGIAITALSLFIRSLSFNLRDRVSRAFATILACVVIVFSGEAISSAATTPEGLSIWLKIQWIGLLYFPAAYMHFADALLETTGRPSRGRRRMGLRIAYIASTLFLISLPLGYLVGDLQGKSGPYQYLEPKPLSYWFGLSYLFAVVFAAVMIFRAYRRTRLVVSRRRLWYLQIGAFLLAVGTYPYLQFGSGFASEYSIFFLGIVTLGNVAVFWFLVLMAYAVAFFGVPWPDRMIRSRLLKWLLRGPVTMFVVLVLMTVVQIVSRFFGEEYSVAIPIITVTTVLFLEHVITLIYPSIERLLFFGEEREDIRDLGNLQERFISLPDLRQFLESVLASVCDQFQVSTAFVGALSESGLEMVVFVGDRDELEENVIDENVLQKVGSQQNGNPEVFAWGDFWLYPLHSVQQPDEFLGLLGVLRLESHEMDTERMAALAILGQRSALALEDRRLQQQVLSNLQTLGPRVDYIQRLRAASRYNQRELLLSADTEEVDKDFSQWVKDALSHYWGGPKLTDSPLLGLEVVQKALKEHDGNPVNALRATLKEAVDHVRPEGERRFTAEWILYNILEMKFMEGRKVREIALRLAMSEADLYRKQRVAIEAVARAIAEMEQSARAN